jgi:glycosyltransferase involved in cell wall biosynthesis
MHAIRRATGGAADFVVLAMHATAADRDAARRAQDLARGRSLALASAASDSFRSFATMHAAAGTAGSTDSVDGVDGRVVFHLARMDADDYKAAAAFVNRRRDISSVLIQHEFGLFGGADGAFVLLFANALAPDVRLVTVGHTVQLKPIPFSAREVLRSLAALSDAFVVMTRAAVRRLDTDYSVDPDKIKLIPHGAGPSPITPIVSADDAAAALFVGDEPADPSEEGEEGPANSTASVIARFSFAPVVPVVADVMVASVEAVPRAFADVRVLAGWPSYMRVVLGAGLIGPSKGFEVAIEALGMALSVSPDLPLGLVIAGQPHPDCGKPCAEYYTQLQARAREIDPQSRRIVFLVEFFSDPALDALIASADAVLAMYSDDVSSSGITTRALSAGRPVFSSGFSYAREVLADGGGVVLSSRNASVLAGSLLYMCANPRLFAALSQRATVMTRQWQWPVVARRYASVLTPTAEQAAARRLRWSVPSQARAQVHGPRIRSLHVSVPSAPRPSWSARGLWQPIGWSPAPAMSAAAMMHAFMPMDGVNCSASNSSSNSSSNGCFNGGICVDMGNSSYCLCPPTWTGTHCTIPVFVPCTPNTNNTNGTGSYDGNGNGNGAGWSWSNGTDWNNSTNTTGNPCQNDGVCNENTGYCACPIPFFGQLCQDWLSVCNPNAPGALSCANGGVCVNSTGAIACSCQFPWYGPLCESLYCSHGVPSNSTNGTTCDCTYPYSPQSFCQQPMACLNGGTLVVSGASTSCHCRTGAFGTACEYSTCAACASPGTLNCTGEWDLNVTCTCREGWSGEFCDIPLRPCTASTCSAPGTLYCYVDAGGSAQCACRSQYTGPQCQYDLNSCRSNPCNATGTVACVSGFNSFTCNCKSGYSGTLCQLSPCSSMPCSSPGTAQCVVLDSGGFACDCRSGYSGELCSDRLQCPSGPCYPPGTTSCVEQPPNGYSCNCAIGNPSH